MLPEPKENEILLISDCENERTRENLPEAPVLASKRRYVCSIHSAMRRNEIVSDEDFCLCY